MVRDACVNGGNAAGRTAGEGRRCRGDASSMTPPYYHLAVLAAVCASCLVCSTEAFQGLPLQGHGLSRLQQGGMWRRGVAAWSSSERKSLLLAKKADDTDDLSKEFASRLEDDDDEDDAPLRRKKLEDDPVAGPGGLNRFFTVPGTRGYSKESGNDYWIDPALQKKKAGGGGGKKKKAPAKDQFPTERIKAEIVSPYKNNWILLISITIFSIAFFGYLFPEEFSQVPSIRIPDFEATPTPFGSLNNIQ